MQDMIHYSNLYVPQRETKRNPVYQARVKKGRRQVLKREDVHVARALLAIFTEAVRCQKMKSF